MAVTKKLSILESTQTIKNPISPKNRASKIGQATIRSGWIVRQKEDFPRLTSCYVLKQTGV